MSVYKLTELVGSSQVSYEDATHQAVERAQKTLRHLEWFEVKEMRGAVHEGNIEYQVRLELGFHLEE